MFETNGDPSVKPYVFAMGIFSLLAFVVTAWVLANVRHEQEIVTRLVSHLQGSNLQMASELSSELGLQRSLSVLLVLNTVAVAIAFLFVVRGFLSSERNLKDAKVLAADILASMDAGVITTDMIGGIISINPRGRELIGSEDAQPVRSLKEIGSEHALLASICDELRRNHHPIRDRDYHLQRRGLSMTLRAGCTMLKDRNDAEIGIVIHVRDVTERVLMEERMRRMERYMGLGTLAAGLQHEIKNPLSALSLHVQLLSERLKNEASDDVHEMLDVLNTEVQRIGDVLDGFRNYASIHELGREPVFVSLLIEKLIRLLRPEAEQRKVHLEFDNPTKEKGTIKADSAQLEQVLLNLALNAFAAMPDGGTLRFSLSKHDGKLKIDISDTGQGISLEIQSQVFDPYFTTRREGTGMGLAHCDKIVRQHNGSIDFQTSAIGTTFTIQLPIAEAN